MAPRPLAAGTRRYHLVTVCVCACVCVRDARRYHLVTMYAKAVKQHTLEWDIRSLKFAQTSVDWTLPSAGASLLCVGARYRVSQAPMRKPNRALRCVVC